MRFATRLVQVCSAAVLIATSSSALAASVGPTKPSQIVTVTYVTTGPNAVACGGAAGFFAPSFMGKSDGSVAPFAIPPKSVFVITSFAYRVVDQGASTVGTITLAAIDAAHPPAVGSTSAIIAGAITDAAGTLVGQSVLPTGMVIKPPALPCVGAPLPGTVVVTLNGFFTKDK
jgi:hypothetical protein